MVVDGNGGVMGDTAAEGEAATGEGMEQKVGSNSCLVGAPGGFCKGMKNFVVHIMFSSLPTTCHVSCGMGARCFVW